MDCSQPGSSIQGILQARILKWVAISFSTIKKKNTYKSITIIISCQETFNFKESNMFFFCVLFLKDSIPYQFLENRSKQSCTEFSGLRSWEAAPAWIPFSDSLQWLPSVTLLKCNLFSYAPLTQDMECFLALWRLLFAWLCFCSIFFLLPKAVLYEDI